METKIIKLAPIKSLPISKETAKLQIARALDMIKKGIIMF